MWKKIVIGVVIVGGMVGGIWYGLQSIEDETAPLSEAIQAVPSSAAFIFETQNLHNLWRKLSETNVMWSELQSTEFFASLQQTGFFVDSIMMNDEEIKTLLTNRSVVISAHMSGASRFDFIYSTSMPTGQEMEAAEALIDRASSGKAIQEKRTYDGTNVTEVKIAGSETKFSYTVKNGLFISSESSALVEDAIRHLNKNASLTDNLDFMQVQRTAGIENTDGNLYINYRSFPNMLATHLNMSTIKQVVPLSAFASWSEVDMLLKPNALSFEGFTYSNDTINNYLNIFLEQEPVTITLPEVLPANTAIFMELGISDPEKFLKTYRKYLDKNNRLFAYEKDLEAISDKCECDVNETLLSWLGDEIGIATTEPLAGSTERNKFVVMTTNSLDNATSGLTKLTDGILANGKGDPETETFKEYTLKRIHVKNLWSTLLGELFTGLEDAHFSIVDDYVVFASSRNALRTFIQQYEAEKTLAYDPNFVAFSDEIASASNILIYTNIARSPYLYMDYLTEEEAKDVETNIEIFRKFEAAAIQYSSYKKNLFLNNIFLKYNPVYKQVTSSLWETQLDTTISREPWLFKNHTTNNLDVVVQDDANTLYLLSTTGNVLWKRHLAEPIMGDIQTIDIYKNNKYQLMFNTRSNIYLIDRLGKDVTGFPVALDAPASHQMAVMDYDKNRDYRFLIPCINNQVYNYNQLGKKVEGWAFKGTSSLVKTDIRHFVVNSKDYIFVAEEAGKIHLLDRRGGERVNSTSRIVGRSNNPVFIEKANQIGNCRVVYTDTTGSVIKAWFNGHQEKIHAQDFSTEHFFMYADLDGDKSSDFIFTDGNKISVLQRDGQELFTWTSDSTLSSRPVLVKGSDGVLLLGLVKKGSNEVILLNQNGTVVEGMPLYGGSIPVIGDINRDGSLNMITTHPDQNVYTYTLR